MSKYQDFPFIECCAQANEILSRSPRALIFQKFTCSGCGQRLTIDVPNHFYETGTCDKCPTVTDIKAQGCNYLIHMRIL